MASAILHIKDSYYFEVPKQIWRAEYEGMKVNAVDDGEAFPDWLVKLDQDYLDWQAKRIYAKAPELDLELPPLGQLMADYHHWLHEGHDHPNVGKPLSAYLEATGMLDDQLQDAGWAQRWVAANQQVGRVADYRADASVKEWSPEKIEGYNHALSGKILVPQPFGTLKNLYEPASGFCISKFMVIQLVVALLLAWLFIWLVSKMRSSGGEAVKGPMANALEAILLYMRDDVARSAIGAKEGDRYVPLLWTMFFFVLGLNLMGMVPWVGAPTSAFACTGGLAAVTFGTGLVMGSKKFGIVGFWKNQVPSMDLPAALALPIKSLLFLIEVLGLFIKHGVLAVRLLANMFAGHIVLLGILALAFSWQGAMSSTWWLAAPISVISSTLFSLLELFVAFLQAYVFTFLSALFIGASVHHH